METVMKFSNVYPQTDSYDLFSKRFELSYVLKGEAEKVLDEKILELFPSSKSHEEFLSTTYFEPVLSFLPERTCIARFRQRVLVDNQSKEFIAPPKWLLSGPGNLEIKMRSAGVREQPIKMGTFLPDSKGHDIYALIKLSKLSNKKELIKFISTANEQQLKELSGETNGSYRLIIPNTFLKISKYFNPHATRICLRKTYSILKPKKARITIESQPSFYAYPIYHKVFGHSAVRNKYYGYLGESPDRIKLDIKCASRHFGKKIENMLVPYFKDFRIPKNNYTKDSYYTLIVNASKHKGTVVEEYQNREIEVKANIVSEVGIKPLIESMRIFILRDGKAPYRLFPTDPDIDTRGNSELNRTIIGWQDEKGKWHEIVTVIRLNKLGDSFTILKWKKDPKNNSFVMDRDEKKEILIKDITNKSLLNRLGMINGKKPQVVGIFKKMKYRIIVQDKDGRNFTVSLDESRVEGSSRILHQLEVEYRHLIVTKESSKPSISVEESCERCMNYFIKVLKDLDVTTEKTQLRKIDFVSFT